MSRCTPSTALTRRFEPNRWQLVDYETEEGVKGSLVSAFPDQNCGELTLPLEAEGLHKIYLGINYTKAPYPEWSPYGHLEVKLTGESGFRRGRRAGRCEARRTRRQSHAPFVEDLQ
jgi:hypothetical protein